MSVVSAGVGRIRSGDTSVYNFKVEIGPDERLVSVGSVYSNNLRPMAYSLTQGFENNLRTLWVSQI